MSIMFDNPLVGVGIAILASIVLFTPTIVAHLSRLERDYCLSHLIIAKLVSRGEPVEQFRVHVEVLVQSKFASRSSCGTECRKKWFPNMTPGYNYSVNL